MIKASAAPQSDGSPLWAWFKHVVSTLLALACMGQMPVVAADFSVNPIRLELGGAARSGAINVRNESPGKISFQLQAMAWEQDDKGQDRYVPTNDLVYFPRIMTIEPGREAVVRVGIRNAVVPTEKTYRLFIEELDSGNATESGSGGAAKVTMLIRFGAPIFVAPLTPVDDLALENLSLSRGVLSLTARNTGNRHQVVEGVFLQGTDTAGVGVFALTLADRYLLTGTAKGYTTAVPADVCARLALLSVEFKTNRKTVTRQLPVVPTLCN